MEFSKHIGFRLLFSVLVSCAIGAPAAADADAAAAAADGESVYDVVVYGATSGAVAAAVQVRKMGKTVVIINPDRHVGGLTSSGLGQTDSGNKRVIGGLSREFYQRVWKAYQPASSWRQETRQDFDARGRPNRMPIDDKEQTMWVFEPGVAEGVFCDWLEEYEIPLVNGRLDRREGKGILKEGKRITALVMESGEIYRGKMFIDATYEGDLLPVADVSYVIGREGNAKYGETLNGIQTQNTRNHVFNGPVDPYVVPGDLSSGLLPGINADAGGEDGEPDHRVQSYCYRLTLTDDPSNRMSIPKPEGYDERDFELFFRYMESGDPRLNQMAPWINSSMPNRKTDINNRWAVSTNLIGGSEEYPSGSYERRREIEEEQEYWQRGIIWSMANHPRVPEPIRDEVSVWGLCKDEFTGNGNWPYMIYIRVGRRMVSDYVMTEHDCRTQRIASDSVGMGSYAMDSHNVQRYVTPRGEVQNEGNIEVGLPHPYAISYRSIVPRRGEVENLFVPWAVSSSHIAFGSIRMEPVFMVLGQSAATAAVMSIDQNIAVQDVEYEQLRQRLEADGQVLYFGATQQPITADAFPGVVIEAEQAELAGEWLTSKHTGPFVGNGYHHDGDEDKGSKTATFIADLPIRGKYDVRASYTSNANRATNVPVVIHTAAGQVRETFNQRRDPPINGMWASLGIHVFDDQAQVLIGNHGTDGYVVIDAVQFVPVK